MTVSLCQGHAHAKHLELFRVENFAIPPVLIVLVISGVGRELVADLGLDVPMRLHEDAEKNLRQNTNCHLSQLRLYIHCIQ